MDFRDQLGWLGKAPDERMIQYAPGPSDSANSSAPSPNGAPESINNDYWP